MKIHDNLSNTSGNSWNSWRYLKNSSWNSWNSMNFIKIFWIFHEFHEISWISPNMSQMVGFLTKRTVFPSTRPVCNVISVFPRFVINFMFWYQVVPQKPVISWSGKSTGQHISESMSYIYIYILKVDFMILVIYSILVFKWNHPRLSFCSWGTQWESQNGQSAGPASWRSNRRQSGGWPYTAYVLEVAYTELHIQIYFTQVPMKKHDRTMMYNYIPCTSTTFIPSNLKTLKIDCFQLPAISSRPNTHDICGTGVFTNQPSNCSRPLSEESSSIFSKRRPASGTTAGVLVFLGWTAVTSTWLLFK